MNTAAPSPALLDFAKTKLVERLNAQHGEKSEPIRMNMLAERMKKIAAMSSDDVAKLFLTELPAHEFHIC